MMSGGRKSILTEQHTSLKVQFEQQSQQFAELLSTLQKVTVELDDEKTSRQRLIDEASQETKAATVAAESRANGLEEEIGTLREQHADEVSCARHALVSRSSGPHGVHSSRGRRSH